MKNSLKICALVSALVLTGCGVEDAPDAGQVADLDDSTSPAATEHQLEGVTFRTLSTGREFRLDGVLTTRQDGSASAALVASLTGGSVACAVPLSVELAPGGDDGTWFSSVDAFTSSCASSVELEELLSELDGQTWSARMDDAAVYTGDDDSLSLAFTVPPSVVPQGECVDSVLVVGPGDFVPANGYAINGSGDGYSTMADRNYWGPEPLPLALQEGDVIEAITVEATRPRAGVLMFQLGVAGETELVSHIQIDTGEAEVSESWSGEAEGSEDLRLYLTLVNDGMPEAVTFSRAMVKYLRCG